MQELFKSECPTGALESVKAAEGYTFIGSGPSPEGGARSTLSWGEGEHQYQVTFEEIRNYDGYITVSIGNTSSIHRASDAQDMFLRLLNAGYKPVGAEAL